MDIGAWGDSITYGEGDAEALGWVGRLRKQLSGNDLEIYNRGICGDTSTDVLKRFDIEAASIQPATIILAIGINDSKFQNGVSEHYIPPATFKENIAKLIAKALAVAQRVVVVGLTEVKTEKIERTSLFTNEAIKEYNDYVKEAASSAGVEFVSMSGVLDTEADLEDGLHPNATGYEKMYRAIAPMIR